MSSRKPQEPVYYTSLLKLSADDITEKLAAGPQEAARVAYAAAAGGSKVAQVAYGQMLLDGYGVDPDPQAAFRWFGIAALADDPDGINMLGRCHELGWGTPVDWAQALACYRRAAAKDHAFAQFNLGTLLLRADPTPGEVATALTLFVRSARQGNAKAMNMIGRYREGGFIGRIDLASARRWYRRAAERGCFRGAAHLARFLLSDGRISEAVDWYRRSADQAPVDFCRDLAGSLFASGHPAIRAVARHALRCAAESDRAEDLFAYGQELIEARGGPADLKEAAVWLGRAEAKGFPGALALLAQARPRSSLVL